MDNQTNVHLVKIANHVAGLPHYVKKEEKDRFLGKADAVLIACAAAHNHIIVTNETKLNPDPRLSKVKIPNICSHFGVDCVTPFQMLRQLGASFGLMPKQHHQVSEPFDEDDGDSDGEDED